MKNLLFVNFWLTHTIKDDITQASRPFSSLG